MCCPQGQWEVKKGRWAYDNISGQCYVEYDPQGYLTPEDGDGKRNVSLISFLLLIWFILLNKYLL